MPVADAAPDELEQIGKALSVDLVFASVLPAEFGAAVVIGSSGLAQAALLPKRAPAIRHLLVFAESNELTPAFSSRVRELQQQHGLEVSVCSLAGPSESQLLRAYLSFVQFLLPLELPLERVLFAGEYCRTTSKSSLLVSMLADIRWHRSRGWLQFAGELNQDALALLLEWARYLERHGHLFHALKFLYFLRAWVSPAELAQSALHCLSGLECYDAMAEWLSHLGHDPAVLLPLRRDIRTSVDAQAEERQQLFEKNVAALERFHPELAARLRDYRSPGAKIHCAITRDVPWFFQFTIHPLLEVRPYALFFSIDQGKFIEHNPPINPEQLVLYRSRWANYDSLMIGSVSSYNILIGCAANPGRLVEFEDCHFAKKEQAVYVLEKDLTYFFRLLHAEDFTALFEADRVHFFVGEDAPKRWRDYLFDHPLLPLPGIQISCASEVPSVIEDIIAHRKQREEALQRQILEMCSSDHEVELDDLLAGRGSRRLRVWMHTSNFNGYPPTHLRDLQEAIDALGFETCLLHESRNCERLLKEGVFESLLSFRPDVVLLYNDYRGTLPFKLPAPLPVLTMLEDPDPPLFDTENLRQLGKNDFVFAACPWFLQRAEELGYSDMRISRFAVNPRVHVPDPSLPLPTDEVVAVNQMSPQKKSEPVLGLAPGMTAWLHQTFAERGITYVNWWALAALFEEGARALGVPRQADVPTIRYTFAVEREFYILQVLRWLKEAGVRLALYGRHWDEWPEFKEFALGEVLQGAELSRVYQRGKVLLHVAAQLNCHQRVFEGLASGAFVVVRSLPHDRHPGRLCDHFDPGREIMLFSTREELLEIVERAFSDEPWRQSILQAGHERALAEHTYAHRMKWVFEQIREVRRSRRS